MKRSVIVLLSAAVLTGFASLASAEAKIGVVNTARLMREAPQARALQATLDAEFSPRTKEINTMQQQLKTREEKLQKDGATMTELQRSADEKALRDGYRELKLKQDSAEEDFGVRRDEEMQKLQRTLIEAVQVFAKAQNFDLILADNILYAASSYDVTAQVLTGLQGAKPAAAAPAAPAPAARPAATPAKP